MSTSKKVLLVISEEDFSQELLDSIRSQGHKSVALFEVSEDSPPRDHTPTVSSPLEENIKISVWVADMITGMVLHEIYSNVPRRSKKTTSF
jgi:hypothetical protein